MEHTLYIQGVPKPAKHFFPSGAVCGNGDLCLMYGAERAALTIRIAKTDFWKGLPGGRTDGGIKTVGSLRIAGIDPAGMTTEQRLDEGLLASACGDVRWTVFLSPQNVAVLQFCSPVKRSPITAELLPAYGGGSRVRAWRSAAGAGIERGFSGGELLFESAVCVILREAARVVRDGVRTQTFFLTAATDQETSAYRQRAQSLADEADAETLRRAHDAWWQAFWRKSSVCLSDKAAELQWYADLYLLACCCGHPEFPPGLFGSFIPNDNAPWHGDYHLNYNYQAPFYGVFSANHPELSDGYEAPLLAFMPEGERNAREFLSCRGIYYPVGVGPKGLNTSRAPSIEHDELFLGQKSDAAYGAVIMILRWNATRDTAYAEKVYTYIRAVTDFFEDYMDFADGRYWIRNDAIHEVPFYWEGFTYGCEDDFSTDTNNLLTLGLVRMVFAAASDMAQALGRDAEKLALWREMTEKISPFPTFRYKGKEVFRYTEQGLDWRRDNSLCIQHIFPAGQIGLSSDKHLLQVARDTFAAEDRSTDDNGTNSYLPAGARLGIGEEYLLSALHRNYAAFRLPNGLFDHAGGGVEHNSTTLTTVNEMLLQSYTGVVRLFPVWRSDASFTSLRADGAFLVSASQCGGTVEWARITSEKGGLLRVENPYPTAEVVLPNGTRQTVEGEIRADMRPGDTVEIRKKA
ncbi:MAG: hypothetical protein IJT44_13425 [Clostridia bacterium]|nr:hypothetical protein [Clostridia bacterium]